MSDFKFLQNPISGKWVISAPRRAHRPGVSKDLKAVCPFCPGKEKDEKEVYRILANQDEVVCNDSNGCIVNSSDWLVRVIPNKYPFAPIHEVVVHSPDHHKNFGELPLSQTELIFKAFRQRYQSHSKEGQVYIFHNRGEAGGESLSHPHSQLVVISKDVKLDIPGLDQNITESIETDHFNIVCPQTSEWPDEVWLVPRSLGEVGAERTFGDITDEEISDLSNSISRIIQILDLRHAAELPFNFYIASPINNIASPINNIYPRESWYLRITPRLKTLGGFEIGTGVFVNTQDPLETLSFLKEHFENPDEEKIKSAQQAIYKKAV